MTNIYALKKLPNFSAYDPQFQGAAAKYLESIGIGWLMLKAQGIQESGLNPLAVSPAGAVGLMQFMPGTWDWVTGSIWPGENKDRDDPEASILAGAAYMAWLAGASVPGLGRYTGFAKIKPTEERYTFALAAYNAGQGNIQKARLLAAQSNQSPDQWWQVSPFLGEVTHGHAEETRTYITNIRGICVALLRA